MAMTQTKLHDPSQLGNSVSTLYTVPASTTAILKQITLCNVSANNRTVQLYVVPNGGTAGVANALLYDMTVDATSTMFVNLSSVMETGATLQGLASVAAAITIHSSGIQET
mgnify:CR=1 FL=1